MLRRALGISFFTAATQADKVDWRQWLRGPP
eukprot:COSAG04_NODE_11815_length_687_cov_0.763605_2_plen_30_part_01